jgi:hypothetical protein
MGFLARLFSGREATEVALTEDQLEPWFIDKAQPFLEKQEFKKQEIVPIFSDKVKDIEIALALLERAKLQNPKMPQRAFDFMEGNRKNYVQQVNSVLQNMPPLDANFPTNFEPLLKNFAKRTERNYHVLQEFFAHETKDVLTKVRAVYDLGKDFAGASPEFRTVNEIFSDFNYLREENQNIKRQEDLILVTEASIQLREEEDQEVDENIRKKKVSEEFERLLNLKEVIRLKENEILQTETEIINFFSPFSKLIKKYQRTSVKWEKLLGGYSEDSLMALEKDEKLRILESLREGALRLEMLGFDSRDQDKIGQRVGALDANKVTELQLKYKNVKQTLKDAKKDLERITVIEEIDKLNKEKESVKSRREELVQEISKIRESIQLHFGNIQEVKQALPSKIESLTGVKVDLV